MAVGRILPLYSRKQVNKAGDILAEPFSWNYTFDDIAKWTWAFDVLNNWRSSHVYPINTFQATLRSRLGKIDHSALVAQRLKRTPSIVKKLERFPQMKLSRMQDIGGLRAVLRRNALVYELVEGYVISTRLKHELVSIKDYIASPKPSGYRSIHLIYRYNNPKAPEYNGLSIEIQVRSRIQHAWATAVETMGTFIEHSLKSSEGPKEWLNFFSLAGSAFAHLEQSPPVDAHAHLSREEVYAATLEEAERLQVAHRLRAFAVAADQIEGGEVQGHYHLIVLDTQEKAVSIKSYGRRSLQKANQDYTEYEKRLKDGERIQVVLVSAGNISNLRRAYPNYFFDTRAFIKQLEVLQHCLQKTMARGA
jgi:ppGpp synthetase/RelA/SpoT-type nucleotidyltranferase